MTTEYTQKLISAAQIGDLTEVQRCIPFAHPSDQRNKALQMAAKNGHVECIEALLPFSDPLADDSYALTTALKHNHQSCVDLLYPVSGAPALLQRLQTTYPDQLFLWDKLEQLVLSKEGVGHKSKM